MALRLLVAEGNTLEDRKRQASSRGSMPSEAYAAVLKAIVPDAHIDLCFPADLDATLPAGSGFSAYDGIFITGSALSAYEDLPEIHRQIAFTRQALQHDTPLFGSCWGLQLLTVAAGGVVRRNPKGIEFGFARQITPNAEGAAHALLRGRPLSFDAPAVHFDEVSVLADGMRVLAFNAMSEVQAAEIKQGNCVAWGVQYHPEFSLHELAEIALSLEKPLLAEGIFASSADVAQWHAEMKYLDAEGCAKALLWKHALNDQVMELAQRRTEIGNFLRHVVQPLKAARGRA